MKNCQPIFPTEKPLTKKAALRQEMRSFLKGIADTVEAKSLLIRNNLITMNAFRCALQSERLMSFIGMPMEVNTIPLFAGKSIIVPYCEAEHIIPIRILSLDEIELSGRLNILEPKLTIRQDVSRQVSPEQIDVVLVPGLAFDHFGNRLGRGRGYYDRFLRWIPADVLTIGLAFEGMVCEWIPHNENDCPVKIVLTESRRHVSRMMAGRACLH